MKHLQFTYWQDGEYYIGFLNDYADYQTQGESLEELTANLKDLYADIESEEITCIKGTRITESLILDNLSQGYSIVKI